MIRIFVDADACPVKKEIERISTRHNIKTFLVCNGGIRPPINPNMQLVVVNQKLDAADDVLVDSDDDFGFNETTSFFQDQKKYNPVSGSDESI